MEELVIIIGNTCLKHHDSGEASVNREARLIIQALKEKGYEIIKLPTGEVTQGDFQNIMIEELEGGTGYEQGSVIGKPKASEKCFLLAQQMVAYATGQLTEENKDLTQSKNDLVDVCDKLKDELSSNNVEIKTIEQCKDEVAKKQKWDDFNDLLSCHKDNLEVLNKYINEAMQLYFNQGKSNTIEKELYETLKHMSGYFTPNGRYTGSKLEKEVNQVLSKYEESIKPK